MSLTRTVAAPRYPVVPSPVAGELLSSWIERVGLFYGTPYEPWIASLVIRAGIIASPVGYDADADGGLRDVMKAIATCDEAQIPLPLDANSPDVLILGCRTTFCPSCWDADVEIGNVPYVRRAWSSWHCVVCADHRAFLWTRPRIGHRVAQGWDSWASLWRSRATWAKSLQIPRDHALSDNVLSYSPCRPFAVSAAAMTELSAEIGRLFPDGRPTEALDCQDGNERRRAAQILELAMSAGFTSVTEDVRCEIVRGRDAIRLCAQRFDSRHYLSAPLRPQLLENRVTLLMMVVEILRMMDDRPSLNERIANALTLSVLARRALDKPDVQRYLLGWDEVDRVRITRCWPSGPAARLKVREILAHRPAKRRG